MLRLLKAFFNTGHSLLYWTLWSGITLAAVLLYGFTVGGTPSWGASCVLCCILSGTALLLSADPKRPFSLRIAYALLKGFGGVLLAIVLYVSINNLSPTRVSTYDTRAEEIRPTRSAITVYFTDPHGERQSGEMPDYGCMTFTEAELEPGDPITVQEYEGIFGLTRRAVTPRSEKGETLP